MFPTSPLVALRLGNSLQSLVQSMTQFPTSPLVALRLGTAEKLGYGDEVQGFQQVRL